MRYAILSALLLTAGCADTYLDQQEGKIFKSAKGTEDTRLRPAGVSEDAKEFSGTFLEQAAAIANELSGAYFRAAKQSRVTQDVASGVVLVAGVSVVGGLAGSASETSLIDKALIGASAERVASSGVSKASIEGILRGAKAANCISAVATIHAAADSNVKHDPLAKELTYAAIREVRISVRNDIAREVDSFASVVEAFNKILPERKATQDNQIIRNKDGRIANRATKAELKTYLTSLSGCLKSPNLQDNVNKAKQGGTPGKKS